MAKATRNNNTTTKEETKMAKYIVEAPEPKKGQKVSSGGIRENGKLASQFKNPVVIDVEADEIETVYDDDKIIRFPNRKAI